MKYIRTVTFLLSFFLIGQSTISFAKSPGALSKIKKHQKGLLFTISGSNTLGAKLAPTWAKHYLAAKGLKNVTVSSEDIKNEYIVEGKNANNSIYISIKAHGSSTGFKALLNNEAEVAMSSRKIKKTESDSLAPSNRMTDFGSEHIVAIDGLAIIVHPNLPIDRLNVSKIADIFSGEITNWSQLNGPNVPIKPHARDKNSGTWDTFNNLVLRKQYQLTTSTPRFESNDELSNRVSNTFGAIGFVGLASVHNAKPLAIYESYTKPMLPKPLLVATEDYLLSRRLYMYTNPSLENEYVMEFLEFIQTQRGQNIVSQVGFVSQTPVIIPTPDSQIQGAPIAYIQATKNAQRLSLNFRFDKGSSELDNKAKRDLVRLAEFMKAENNKSKELLLIGFGDSKNNDKRSVILSKHRALAVKYALQKLGVKTHALEGLGSYLPVAENKNAGKVKNRRVEVWIRG